MARFEIPEGYTIGVIATMPRSGTWYSFYFFEFLDVYLSSRATLNTRMDLEVYHSLKVGKINVHTICPGFPDIYDGPFRQAWDKLAFHDDGYNYGYPKFIGGNIGAFSPALNPDVRIIYLYRNPLDQAVSYFRHARHNKNKNKLVSEVGDGTPQKMKSASEFLRKVGLKSYIKQFFTFEALRETFPENIFMVPYEQLVHDPEATFTEMLKFWGVETNSEHLEACVRKALNSTTPESLRNVESALKSSLARDQMKPGESHMRSGKIGQWRDHFDANDIGFTEDQMSKFGLSLDMFQLG